MDAQADAGQRMVAVEHHVLRIDLGDGVDAVRGHVGRRGAFGQALELHADVDVLGEDLARLEAHEIAVVIAEGIFRLERDADFVTGGLVDQRFLDLREQVLAAVEELHRRVQDLDGLALGVLQSPGQGDDAGGSDLHRAILSDNPCP